MANESGRGLSSDCLSGSGTPQGSVGRAKELGKVSNSAKWVIAAICAILGIIALVYAAIYLAVPIHSLPGFVPGKKGVNGHYHKRALLSAVIGIVLLAIAVYLGVTAQRATATQIGSGPDADTGTGS
jgi:uncharacterized membrane protein